MKEQGDEDSCVQSHYDVDTNINLKKYKDLNWEMIAYLWIFVRFHWKKKTSTNEHNRGQNVKVESEGFGQAGKICGVLELLYIYTLIKLHFGSNR